MNAKSPKSPRRSRNPKQLQRILRRMLCEAVQLHAEAEAMKKRATQMIREAGGRSGTQRRAK